MWKAGFCSLLLLVLATSTSVVKANHATAYMAHNVTPHSSGITVDYTLKRTDAANQDWYKKAKVHYPKEKGIKRVLNARKRVDPLSIGLAAAVAAAGWAIDELTNQITSPSSVPDSYVPGMYYYWKYMHGAMGRTPEEACSNFTYQSASIQSDPYGCKAPQYFSSDLRQASCSPSVPAASGCASPPPETQTPLSEDDLWAVIEDVLSDLPPEVLREIFESSGVPILTPELAEALADYAAETGATSDTSNQNDESTADEENPESKQEPLPDDKQDLQQISVEKVDWDISVGSGSCPQSKSVSGMFPIDSQWGTVCDAAQNIFKPLFLLLCALGSAAIVSGQRLFG